MNKIRKSIFWRRPIEVLASAFLLVLLGSSTGYAGDAPVDVNSFMHEVEGINYYVEKRGSGPALVMVTSGQGDSGAYKLLADILAEDFTVITFDPPGFSRSGPPPSWANMSSATLGDQVAAFVKSLGIEKATFYGSSSGGTSVLSVVADHPELVRNAIVHEPAVVSDFPSSPYVPPFKTMLAKLQKKQADKYGGFAQAERANIEAGNSDLIMNPKALNLLDEGHIERRINNKKIWYDRYVYPDVPCCNRIFTAAELNRAPIQITVGASTWGVTTAGHMALAQRGDLKLTWLPGKHFPYISFPQVVADVIRKSTSEYL